MKRIYYLYKLQDPEGNVYIGQTISINRRFSNYRNNPNKSQFLIYSSIKKHGWNNLTKEIIFDGYLSQKQIDELECLEIKKYTQLGISLNIMKHVHSPEYAKGEAHCKSRKVVQISLDYELIKEHVSGTFASIEIGVSQSTISHACRSNSPYCAGYYWRFKDEFDIEYLKSITNLPNSRCKEVVQMDSNNNIIKIWESQIQASEELNINQGNIYRVMSGKGQSAGGFRWCYKNDYDKNQFPDYKIKNKGKSVLVFNMHKEFIAKYESVTEASIVLGLDRSNITRQLKGSVKNPKKYLFKYE